MYFNNYFYECIKIENKYLYYIFYNIDIIYSFIFEFNITKIFEYVNENTFRNKSKYFVHKRLFIVQMKIEK